MSFSLSFKLRQHTPILHFQHDQPGATLRATEVKPCLDKFLIQNLGKELTQKWLIGAGAHPALDYKIRFINGKYRPDIPLPTKTKPDRDGRLRYYTNPEMFPQVLANMGGKDTARELKHFRMYESLRVEIFSLYEDLIEALKKSIPAFFAVHNFGNRKSKGFGSFYLDPSDPLYKKPEVALREAKDFAKGSLLFWEIEADLPIADLFWDIDIIYRLLKSGFNFPDHPMKDIGAGRKAPDFDKKLDFATYQPSFLKTYFLNKFKLGSEKRAIKESLFRPEVRIKPDSALKDNQYIRGILGTAEFFEYRDKERKGIVKITSNEVERFQSAITFKVFNDRIFILPGSWKDIEGKSFVFSTERDRTRSVSVPRADTVGFNLRTFLTDFANYFNTMKDDEVERLDDIIQDLGRRRPTPDLIKKYLNCLENVQLQTL